MRLPALLITALLLTSACNLDNQPSTPTAVPSAQPIQATITIPPATDTLLPGIVATSGATRTPFGNSGAPTAQTIGTPGALPTTASGESATISSPANGATVGGSPLYVSGVVSNLSTDQFMLQVFDANGQSITPAQTITLSNPNHVADVPWSASVLVSGYTGAAQIRISAQTASGETAVIGAVSVNIVPATANANPAPSSGSSITSPTNGSAVSGSPITVTGTAGGIPENQFTLLLLNASGTVLNSQLITLTGADQYTVPWSASLGTSGYHGSVEIRAVVIRAGQQITIASAIVTLQ